MKRLVIVGSLLFVFTVKPAEASRLGNPSANLDQDQWSISAEYASVEKDIQAVGVTVDGQSNRILCKISYGLLGDRIEVFGKIGASDSESSTGSFDGDFGVAFGGGVKYTIYEWLTGDESNIRLGLMGQYMRYTSEDNFSVLGVSVSDEVDINEIDAAAGLSFSYKSFTPYAGSYLNFIDGEENVTAGFAGGTSTASLEFEEDELFGVFVGADVEVTPGLKIGVEGRFIDQTTIGAEVSYAF